MNVLLGWFIVFLLSESLSVTCSITLTRKVYVKKPSSHQGMSGTFGAHIWAHRRKIYFVFAGFGFIDLFMLIMWL